MTSEETNQKPQKSLLTKWVIGCSVVLVAAILIMAGVLFWMLQRSKDIGQYPKKYAQLYKHDNFVPPQDNVISEEDLQTYIEINRKIGAEVQKLTGETSFSFELHPDQTPEEMIKQLRYIRKIQVQAFKETNFSIKKYKWITRQIVICYGGELARKMNLMLRVFRTGEKELDIRNELENIPQQNLDLFEKYHQQIDKMTGILLLGV